MAEPRVACRTPANGRDGVTRVPEWKFDAVRTATLAALDNGPVPFSDLPDVVRARLGSHMDGTFAMRAPIFCATGFQILPSSNESYG